MSAVNVLEKCLEVFVDASYKDGKAGIGVYINDYQKQVYLEYLNECKGSTQAELIAIKKGIEIIKSMGLDIYNVKVMTDSLGLVIKYGGYIEEVKVEWIPRRYNLAHFCSVKARGNKLI